MFFGKKQQESDHYFAIFLKGHEAICFIFDISSGAVSIVGHTIASYTDGWENIVQDIDAGLSRLEAQTGLQPKRAIFYVYSYFVDEGGNLKEPYKSHIKSISSQLDLTPLGYIECYEVVASYLETRDKSPLNVILIELDKSNVDVCVYKSSKRVAWRTFARTSEFVQDLSVVLNELKEETLLPSRLVLYDSSNLDAESVSILGHKWEKDVFVQHPRVEVIREEDLHTQLAQVFMKQLAETTVPEHEIGEIVPNEQPKFEEPMLPTQSIEAAEEPEKEPEVNHDIAQAQEMGFVVDAPQPMKKKFALPKFRIPKLPRFSAVKLSPGKLGGVLPILIGFALILGSIAATEVYLHTASITIYVPSKELTQTFELKDVEVFSGTISATVKDTANTTGSRDEGEKAVGQVDIHNFDDSTKTFAAGETLSVDGKKFTLDQEVTVASASEVLIDGDPVKKPGKARAKVTAAEIGPESNLAKDKRFQIGSLSTSLYFAVNDAAFAGGTRKTVKTVARRDIDELVKDLTVQAKKEVSDKIQNIGESKSVLIDDLTQIKVVDTNSSHEVAEEASNVAVTLEADATYFSYDPQKLKAQIAELFTSEVPEGYTLESHNVSYAITSAENDNGVTLTLEATAVAAQVYDNANVKSNLIAKSESEIESYVKENLKANGYELEISAPVPFFRSRMPYLGKNITLQFDTM